MNTFTKVGNDWCVRVFPVNAAPGQTVEVSTRSRGTKQVTLGDLIRSDQYGWVYAVVAAPRAPAAAPEVVGDLSRIVAMFGRAARQLRWPAIVLDGFRVSIAGGRAAQPGSLTVTGVDAVFNRFRGREERPWFGRVTTAGVFQPGRGAPEGLGERLRRFAADPVGEAAAHGRLTGRCCFCNHRLGEGDDRRSVEIGYGPDCADRYGLPWGTRAAREAAAPRDLGTAAGTAQSRARAANREFAARHYGAEPVAAPAGDMHDAPPDSQSTSWVA